MAAVSLVVLISIALSCFATDDPDSCVLLQQPLRSSQQRHLESAAGCQEVLPLLENHPDELLEVCQEALPAAACHDALIAMGPAPWSADVLSGTCKAWSEAVASKKMTNKEVAALLSRSVQRRSQEKYEKLDASLKWKWTKVVPGPCNATTTNIMEDAKQKPTTTAAPAVTNKSAAAANSTKPAKSKTASNSTKAANNTKAATNATTAAPAVTTAAAATTITTTAAAKTTVAATTAAKGVATTVTTTAAATTAAAAKTTAASPAATTTEAAATTTITTTAAAVKK